MLKRTALLLILCLPVFSQNPNTATFPSQLLTDEVSTVAKDRSVSVLDASIDADDLTLTVDAGHGSRFVQFEIITIEDEQMMVCSVAGDTLTICPGTRGFSWTTAVSHSNGSDVSGNYVEWIVNQLNAEMKAVQGLLGINGTGVLRTNADSTTEAETTTTFQPGVVKPGFRVGCGPLPSTPGTGGVLHCNSSDANEPYWYDGTIWKSISESVTGIANRGFERTGTNFSIDQAVHGYDHGNLIVTVYDFDTENEIDAAVHVDRTAPFAISLVGNLPSSRHMWITIAGWGGPTGTGSPHNLLSVTHTDTNAASPVLGDVLFGNATPAWSKLAGNITTTRKYLSQLGTGSVSAAPTWEAISGTGDVIGPATNTADFVPLWNLANSKTLKNGLAATSTNTASALVQRDSAGDFLTRNITLDRIFSTRVPDGNYTISGNLPSAAPVGLLGINTGGVLMLGQSTITAGTQFMTTNIGIGVSPTPTVNFYFLTSAANQLGVILRGQTAQTASILEVRENGQNITRSWGAVQSPSGNSYERHSDKDIIGWVNAASAAGTTNVTTGLTQPVAGRVGVGNCYLPHCTPVADSTGAIAGTLQSGVTKTTPPCSTTADIGNGPIWFDINTTTTVPKKCQNVAGTVQWVPEAGAPAGVEINCGNFGMDPTETTDSSTALLNCLNSVPSGRFVLPQGHFRLNNKILLNMRSGITLIGTGMGTGGTPGGTTLHWRGGSTDPMFHLQGVSHSRFSDFNIIAHTTLAEGIRIETTAGFVTTRNVFDNIYIQGVSGLIGIGIRGAVGTGTGNGEFMLFNNVAVANYSDAAYSIEEAQMKHWRFNDCQCMGNNVGQYCVKNTVAGGGSFTWKGGGGGYNTVAEFAVNNAGDVVVIEDAGFEGVLRLLSAVGGDAISEWPVIIRSVRVAPITPPGGFDGHLIVFRMAGALQVEGCTFQQNPSASNNYAYDIHMTSSLAQLISKGNHFTSTLTHPYSGTIANVISLNNTINRASPLVSFATNVALPNLLPGGVTVPSTASTACTTGSFAFDASFEYRCVATDTWKRAALATW